MDPSIFGVPRHEQGAIVEGDDPRVTVVERRIGNDSRAGPAHAIIGAETESNAAEWADVSFAILGYRCHEESSGKPACGWPAEVAVVIIGEAGYHDIGTVDLPGCSVRSNHLSELYHAASALCTA